MPLCIVNALKMIDVSFNQQCRLPMVAPAVTNSLRNKISSGVGYRRLVMPSRELIACKRRLCSANLMAVDNLPVRTEAILIGRRKQRDAISSDELRIATGSPVSCNVTSDMTPAKPHSGSEQSPPASAHQIHAHHKQRGGI